METFMMSMVSSVMMFFFAASIIIVIVAFRICTAFSVLALIFKIIVFVSPGWAVVKSDIYVEPTDAMLPQDDGIHTEMPPDDLSLSPTRKHVSISFGVWYYKVCMCDKGGK
jgi:hypothetical protein